MSRAMVILHAIVTAIMPAHRPVVADKDAPKVASRDAQELLQGSRDENARSTCFLFATAERILLGQRSEQLNGHHGEHKSDEVAK